MHVLKTFTKRTQKNTEKRMNFNEPYSWIAADAFVNIAGRTISIKVQVKTAHIFGRKLSMKWSDVLNRRFYLFENCEYILVT